MLKQKAQGVSEQQTQRESHLLEHFQEVREGHNEVAVHVQGTILFKNKGISAGQHGNQRRPKHFEGQDLQNKAQTVEIDKIAAADKAVKVGIKKDELTGQIN